MFDDLIPAGSDPFADLPPGASILRAAQPTGGFVASAKQSAGSLIKGADQLGADFIPGVGKDNALKQYGQEVIDANPTAVHSLGDIADKPMTAAKEAVGNAGASMAGNDTGNDTGNNSVRCFIDHCAAIDSALSSILPILSPG